VRDARTAGERRRPTVLVIDDDALRGHVTPFCRDLSEAAVLDHVACETGPHQSGQSFSFVDLVQTLSHSRKTARISLRRTDGEEATVFTDRGRIVHAIAGDLLGEEAVYRVISWEDEGGFVVHPVSEAPPPTIHVATDAVLMEGWRRLDESRA
jgi:hypothetical protein